MTRYRYIFFALLLSCVITLSFAFSEPVVSNVIVQQPMDGQKSIYVWYDLSDADGDPCLITFAISLDNGITFPLQGGFGDYQGDVNQIVTPGTGKFFIYTVSEDDLEWGGFDLEGDNYLLRVYADDMTTAPEIPGMMFVEGDTFYNGSSDVTLSNFYISPYEVTQSIYSFVMGSNPASGSGVGNSYPVYNVSWFNAIEFCNRRSILEALTPCYTYSTFGTNPDDWPAGWNTSGSNDANISCNWTANGYRLPTEMEWMFAARGGMYSQGSPYSGSNNLTDVGWYNGNAGSTMPVGTKGQNEIDTHDMSGNVLEWCWDGMYSYDIFPVTDPHTEPGSYYRVIRGGSWVSNNTECTVSYRVNAAPLTAVNQIGFRTVRKGP